MRITRPFKIALTLAALTLFLFTVAAESMARGPGGGRGGGPRGGGPRGGPRMGGMHHHRMGPASGGSFASRPGARSHGRSYRQRPPMRSTSPRSTVHSTSPRSALRPDERSPRPLQPTAVPPPADEIQEKREKIDRRDAARHQKRRDEHWDNWRYRRYREELGTTYSSDYFDDDDCEVEVVRDGVTYYECDGVWYQRAYSGGTVNYVVVEGPRSD